MALRLGRVDQALEAWRACLERYQAESDLPRVGGTLRKIGAALAHQGERRAAIEHYQQGMNLLKEGPPSRELVRLYEDAAWLYVQSGDNMLAIYASEKALRLARELGEAAAVSRAHGIFGRVFSRIGDAARARENLEKAVELARGGDDPLEEILALLALGNHLEVAEGDYAAATDTYTEALEVAERIGDVPSQVELHAALAQLAVYRADWEAVRELSAAAGSLAERCGPRAQAVPAARAGGPAGLARRPLGGGRALCTAAPPSWRPRSAGRRCSSPPCKGSRRCSATTATRPPRSARWTARWRSPSARA